MFSSTQVCSKGSPELSTPETVVGKGCEMRTFARRSNADPLPVPIRALTSAVGLFKPQNGGYRGRSIFKGRKVPN